MSLRNNVLQQKVCDVFQEINVDICDRDIQTCHHLKDQGRQIYQQKRLPLNSEGKRQLKGLGAAAVDLPEGNKIFGNESFCLYFQEICNICKKLRDKEKIHQYYTVDGLESFTN